jgi:hypothetical protein
MGDKQRYRGPDIVEMGDVESITTSDGTPVRDNPHQEPPTYYDASKDPTNPVNWSEEGQGGEGESGEGESGSEGSSEGQ